MNKIGYPYYLVKVMNKKWTDKFMDGEIFMRTIASFGDLQKRSEDCKNPHRGDSLEGFCFSFEDKHNPYRYAKDLDGNIYEVEPKQVGMIDILTYREKILCLYALEYDANKHQFIKPDSRMLDFGDTAVIIYNSQEFLRRICNAMLQRFKNGFWTSFKRVDYNVEFSISQPYDEFCKSLSYSWQKEFRIVLDLAQGKFNPDTLKDVTDYTRLTFPGTIVEDTDPDSLADSIILDIGNIRDICAAIPISEFIDCNNILNYIPENAFPPQMIVPMEIPRPAYPTFFKLVKWLL